MKKYEITEEQIKDIAKGGGKTKIKEMFPEAFENKLESGKWYKFYVDNEYTNFLYVTKVKGNEVHFDYGFDLVRDKWITENWYSINNTWILATESEVFEALRKEALKIGYKKGSQVRFQPSNQIRELHSNDFRLYPMSSGLYYLCNGNDIIFINGKWQEIIKEKTISKSEAEKKLTEIINDGNEYKIL